MPVVSNTSPISNLACIGRLELLREQFEMVLIPEAVWRELGALTNPQGKAAIDAAIAGGWIRVHPVESRPMVDALSANLHEGECEAIALAIETRAIWTLLDEREARATAQRMKIRVTGVLGVLLRAKQEKRIGSVAEEMERLRKTAHFFISPTLERKILELAGE